MKLNKTVFDSFVQEGLLYQRELDSLTLYNYTPKCQIEGHWNEVTIASRGLVINWDTHEIVARPFDKFFNYGEGGYLPQAGAYPVSITEKVDGSCGILYRHNGQLKICTRGSFESDQAVWATNKLNSGAYSLDEIPDELTLIFEIVYPENRIVVDYGNMEDLVLLGARNRHTGEYTPERELLLLGFACGFTRVRGRELIAIDKLIAYTKELPANQEGYVVLFSDGSRFKVKGDAYVELHKVLSGYNDQKVINAWVSGIDNELRGLLPEEFHNGFDNIISKLEGRYSNALAWIVATVHSKVDWLSRKEQALHIMTALPKKYHPIAFLVLDSRDCQGKLREVIAEEQEYATLQFDEVV